MRNQTSFRLTSTLLPTDTTATTTTVINKVDSNGDKFYPTFTEETVVLTNDDRTVMETTRAICTDGAITFTKRGLSDDNSETQVPNRKLTWNPWTLAFITAWAWDWIDKDDSITWTGNQTYTGNLTSTGSATYNWLLTTNKWVKYPSFENLAALEAYASPFAWMFAVLESDGELYRYNAVTQTWSVVTTSTPTNPPQASTTTIWTVRGATDAEFAAWTATGSNSELLVATPAQIKGAIPTLNLHVTNITASTAFVDERDAWVYTMTYTAPRDWFIQLYWEEWVKEGNPITSIIYSSPDETSTSMALCSSQVWHKSSSTSLNILFDRRNIIAVKAWTITIKYDITENVGFDLSAGIEKFFYFA